MNHHNHVWIDYFSQQLIPIREIIQNPNWQPAPTADGSIALTRAERLQLLDPDTAASLARNSTLAAKVRHNVTIETAAVKAANADMNLPPHPFTKFRPENASQQQYRMNLPSTVGPGEVDKGASDPEIYLDRQSLARSFLSEQFHPAEYQQAVAEQTEAGGLMYTIAEKQFWYRVGRQQAMAQDADFARNMAHNTQIALRLYNDQL